MHLVDFTIEIYYDAGSYERQFWRGVFAHLLFVYMLAVS